MHFTGYNGPILFSLGFLFFACLHSLGASQIIQYFVKTRWEFVMPFYRLVYNGVALLTFGLTMSTYNHSPVLYVIPGGWNSVFSIGQLCAFLLLCRCLGQLGFGEFVGFRPTVSPRLLTTTGCYRLVRHPQYLLAALFLILNPVMTVQWLLLTIYSSLYFGIGACAEESRLLNTFGESYKRYRTEVPMFLPRFDWVKRA